MALSGLFAVTCCPAVVLLKRSSAHRSIRFKTPYSDGCSTSEGKEPCQDGVLPKERSVRSIKQAWQDLNPQPPLLESGALPIELHAYVIRQKFERMEDEAQSSRFRVADSRHPSASCPGIFSASRGATCACGNAGSTSSTQHALAYSYGSFRSYTCVPCTQCTATSRRFD